MKARPKVSHKKRSLVIRSVGDLFSRQSLNVLLIQTHDNLFNTAIESEIEALKCKFRPQDRNSLQMREEPIRIRDKRRAGGRNTGLEKSNNNLGNRGVVCLHCFGIPVRHFSFSHWLDCTARSLAAYCNIYCHECFYCTRINPSDHAEIVSPKVHSLFRVR